MASGYHTGQCNSIRCSKGVTLGKSLNLHEFHFGEVESKNKKWVWFLGVVSLYNPCINTTVALVVGDVFRSLVKLRNILSLSLSISLTTR